MIRRAWILTLLLALVGCGPDDGDTPGTVHVKRAVPRVLTTFYPTAYFARRIGGEKADVACPLPDDADPITWIPDAATIAEYQAADLVVVNGAELEHWVKTTSLPPSRIVDTAKGFEDRWLRFQTGVTHSHGDGEEHTHEGVDGHTWVDPLLALEQAARIKDALVRGWSAHAETYEAGFAALEKDLRSLDEAFRGLGALPDGEALYTTHAAYRYVAERYGWPLVDLNMIWEPDEGELAEISERQSETPGRFLLWERAPDEQTARIFKGAVGLESIVVSPCKTRGSAEAAGGDYLAAMRANVERLRPAFSK